MSTTRMKKTLWVIVLGGVVLFSVVGYLTSRFVRTESLLEQLNEPEPTDVDPHTPGVQLLIRASTVSRIARIARLKFADSYSDLSRAAGWLTSIGANPTKLIEHLKCVERSAASDRTACDIALEAAVSPPLRSPPLVKQRCRSAWNLPVWCVGEPSPAVSAPVIPDPVPSFLERLEKDPSEKAVEMDAERLVANAETLADELLELRRGLGHVQPAGHEQDPDRDFDDEMLRKGLKEGIDQAAHYVGSRKSRRDPKRPSVALVMSGGAGNGAFTAGFVWRLLDVVKVCRATEACAKPNIDIAIGTSVGALIGVLVDLFFVKGQEQKAADQLLQEFTCTVDSDLYCESDAWIWQLFTGKVKGLTRFDGIERLLRQTLNHPLENGAQTVQWMNDNTTELVTMSVETNSGALFADSDQERPGNIEERIKSILASIVEPGLAEYVEGLHGDGAFVDGGVVTPLPLLEAVNRGAERAIVVSNWTRDLAPAGPAGNAGDVFLRSLGMQTRELAVNEAERAGLVAAARRLVEYHVCMRRFGDAAADPIAPGHDQVEALCERREMGVAPKGTFPWVSSSWQSAWVHRAETKGHAATGYSFDPVLMQPMFLEGVEEYQRRCAEIHRLLDIEGCPPAEEACPRDPVQRSAILKRVKDRFKDAQTCHDRRRPRHCQ